MRIIQYVKTHAPNPRLERKYNLPLDHSSVIEPWLNLSNHGIRSEYPARQVNNVYFDDHNNALFQDTEIGASQRHKFRVRWYGSLAQQHYAPQVEIKCKDGDLVYKTHFPMRKKSRQSFASIVSLQAAVQSTLPAGLQPLTSHVQPIIVNSYHRRYFTTHDRTIRITVDTHLKYFHQFSPWNLNLHTPSPASLDSIVIEIKYPPAQEHNIIPLLDRLPLHRAKHSKYALGYLTTNP